MTQDSTGSILGKAEDEKSSGGTGSRKSRGSRLGGGCLLFFIIAALSGGAYFYHLYAREGSVSRAFQVLRASTEDAAVSAKVKAAFALSKKISTFDIGVDSRQGEVTLTGRVSSPQVRDLVGAIAADISGVRTVHNAVAVDPTALPNPEIGRLSARVVDLEIKAAALEGIQRSPELNAAGLGLDVHGRTVRLSGTVASEALSRSAEAAARGVEGVQGVKNDIVVAEPDPSAPLPPDEALTQSVESSLAGTGAFQSGSIEVLVNAGRVTLKGSVRTVAEKLLAEIVARQVEGVGGVGNELTLESSPTTEPK